MKKLIALAVICTFLNTSTGIGFSVTSIKQTVHDFIFKYYPNEKIARRYTEVYIDTSKKYQVPLYYLVRQGCSESRYKWWKTGDNKQSRGSHMIMIRYFKWQIFETAQEVYKGKAKIKYITNYAHHIGVNVPTAAKILRSYYNRYGSWEEAFIAYGCGVNTSHFKRTVRDNAYAYNLKYIREVFGKIEMK